MKDALVVLFWVGVMALGYGYGAKLLVERAFAPLAQVLGS